MSKEDNFNKISDRRRVIRFFIKQWIYWLVTWWLVMYLWPGGEKKTIGELLFFATWMAFFITITFQWKRIRKFRSSNEQSNTH